MSRHTQIRLARFLPALAVAWCGAVWAQGPAPPPTPAGPAATAPAAGAAEAPGAAVVDGVPMAAGAADPGVLVLPPELQVVRFQAPAGVKVEILGPEPESLAAGDATGITVGLRVGVG